MKSEIEIGMSWSHVKVTDSGLEDRFYYSDSGKLIAKDPDAEYFTLTCDCGKEFKLWTKEWKGKRYIKDCGCGVAIHDETLCIKNFSCNISLVEQIKRYQIDQGLSFSRSVVELIKKGLKNG